MLNPVRVLTFVKSSLDQPQMMVVPDLTGLFVPMSEDLLVCELQSLKKCDWSAAWQNPKHVQYHKNYRFSFWSCHPGCIDSVGTQFGCQSLTIVAESKWWKGDPFSKWFSKHWSRSFRERIVTNPASLELTKKGRFMYLKMRFTVLLESNVKRVKCLLICFCFQMATWMLPPSVTVSYFNVTKLGPVSRTTGGELHWYPAFKVSKDGDKFYRDLHRTLTRQTGYDGLLRVRTSRGTLLWSKCWNCFQDWL